MMDWLPYTPTHPIRSPPCIILQTYLSCYLTAYAWLVHISSDCLLLSAHQLGRIPIIFKPAPCSVLWTSERMYTHKVYWHSCRPAWQSKKSHHFAYVCTVLADLYSAYRKKGYIWVKKLLGFTKQHNIRTNRN